MKTEVYSWRISSELKSELERQAHLRKISISSILDLATREWLRNSVENNDDEEQRRLHRAAESSIGAVSGGDPHRAERAREIIRRRLRSRYAR